jgi:hypothetical protein
MAVILLGKEMDFNMLQPQKAYSPMEATPLPMVIFVISLQLRKALVPIDFTLLGMETDVK